MVIKNKREPVLTYADHDDDDFTESELPRRRSGDNVPEWQRQQYSEQAAYEAPPNVGARGLSERPQLELGDQLVPRHWRQWYARSLEVKATPLEVQEPKRRRWGRMIYLAIVIAGLLIFLNYLAGQTFWYSAKGVVGGHQYQLSPTSVSIVKTIDVSPGDHVSKGQVLVSLKSPQLNQEEAQTRVNLAGIESKLRDQSEDQQATASALQAEIGGLQSQYDALQDQYAYQQQRIDSIRRLAAKGVLNFGDAYDMQQQQMQTKAQYLQVNAKLQADRAQLKGLKATTKGATQSTLANHLATLDHLRQSLHSSADALSLRSPVAGIVAQIPVTQGQTVKPGDPAVIVVPNDEQRTLLYFPPAARASLTKGDTVPITTPDGGTIQMRISHIYPSIQDLPEDLQNSVTRQGQSIVAVAQPINPRDISMLQAGTPVTARVGRWHPSVWLSRWFRVVKGWANQGIQAIG